MSNYPKPAGYVRPAAAMAAVLGFQQAVPPDPKRYAQCRNCKHFRYDDSEYCNAKGALATRRVNLRCSQHKIMVQMGTVCAAHEFAYSHRGDR